MRRRNYNGGHTTDQANRIWLFSDAVAHHPTGDFFLYCRVSSSNQTWHGNLDSQIESELLAHTAVEGARLCDVIFGVERGQLSKPRPHLNRVFDDARRCNAIVSTRDASRYVRPDGYKTKLDQPETPEDLTRLFELADGVMVAARLNPSL